MYIEIARQFLPTIPQAGDYLIISRGARTAHGSIAVYRQSRREHLSISTDGDNACCLSFPVGSMSLKKTHQFGQFLASLFNCELASLPDNEFTEGMTDNERKTSYELKAL
ncbi:MAG TPA: hypothetical protein DEF00_00875 [Candidatus Taylorbacteria bacterium]|nr:MAG: hypothetical protein UY03_C0001G0056 [Parcubacteria group bacterium GW2011_GWA2_47_64]KKU96201.1 MAG: hypothetical protein UY29_C0015G0041 [Parcubacteria group bacterium GW2011_GWC2_48_17]HBV00934.1 hypothetical protein [Candidatus Taylorbacteria bacterium]